MQFNLKFLYCCKVLHPVFAKYLYTALYIKTLLQLLQSVAFLNATVKWLERIVLIII
jgi:hypothetical protein